MPLEISQWSAIRGEGVKLLYMVLFSIFNSMLLKNFMGSTTKDTICVVYKITSV